MKPLSLRFGRLITDRFDRAKLTAHEQGIADGYVQEWQRQYGLDHHQNNIRDVIDISDRHGVDFVVYATHEWPDELRLGVHAVHQTTRETLGGSGQGFPGVSKRTIPQEEQARTMVQDFWNTMPTVIRHLGGLLDKKGP